MVLRELDGSGKGRAGWEEGHGIMATVDARAAMF